MPEWVSADEERGPSAQGSGADREPRRVCSLRGGWMCSAIVAGDGEAGWEEEDPFGMAMGSVDMVGGGGRKMEGDVLRCLALNSPQTWSGAMMDRESSPQDFEPDRKKESYQTIIDFRHEQHHRSLDLHRPPAQYLISQLLIPQSLLGLF